MIAACVLYMVFAMLFMSNWLGAWRREPDAVKFLARKFHVGIIPFIVASSILWPLSLICVFVWCVRELFFGKGAYS